MACITKSSCEITTLLRYYTVLSANSLPMFQATYHGLLFWDFAHCLVFYRSMSFQKPAVFPVMGKEAPNLVDPLD